MLRRGKQLALGVVVFAVVLEVVLQVGALAIALLQPGDDGSAQNQVVCLGDSYTAGIGASAAEQSYPAQLETRLRSSGHPELSVKNGGCPGKDSAFMLGRLPALIDDSTKVLCLVMAFNDTWSQPAPADVPAVARDRGFEMQWRTGRLLALCSRFFDNSWHRESPPAGVVERDLEQVALGVGALQKLGLLQPGDPPPSVSYLPTGPLLQRTQRIERAVTGDRPEAALADARRAVTDFDEAPAALRVLAVAAHAAGEPELMEGALDRLAARAAEGDAVPIENLIVALHATGNSERALAAAEARLAAEPDSLPAAFVAQEAAFLLGDVDTFKRHVEHALRLSIHVLPDQAATIVRHYAKVEKQSRPEFAARLVVAGTLLDGHRGLTRAAIRSCRPAVTWPMLAAAIAEFAASEPELSAALQAVLATMHGDTGAAAAWEATLRAHFRHVVEYCRARDVEVILGTYPFAHAGLERVQRAMGQELGCVVVDIRARFDRELRDLERSDLFVANGHCNDRGYGIMAEEMAAAVRRVIE